MELKQLAIYVKVFELESFSKAAKEVYLSQPSVSAYINSLENELQTKLIYRSAKEFMPTKSGKLFYEYAKDILALRDNSINSIKDLSNYSGGNIDILASSVPSQYILPEAIGAFHKTNPGVVFSIEQADTTHVVNGIAAHRGEIGFVGAKIDNPKCIYQDFMSEKLIMIAPNEKRFEDATADDIGDFLRNEYFVLREPGSGTRLKYEEYFVSEGIKVNDLKVSASFNNTQSIIHAVANGLGLSIVSELAAKHYIRQKMVIPFNIEALPERHFYIVLKKGSVLSMQLHAFIEFVKSYGIQYKCLSDS